MARILLAEDDSSLRGFLTRALERALGVKLPEELYGELRRQLEAGDE